MDDLLLSLSGQDRELKGVVIYTTLNRLYTIHKYIF